MQIRKHLHDNLIFGRGREDVEDRNKLKHDVSLSQRLRLSSPKQSKRSFLDLPTEIRLLIYEAVFPPASVVLQSGDNPAMIAVVRTFPVLISRGSRDVQMFRACRTLHNEAIPIFYRSLNLLVYQHLHLLRLSFIPHIGPANASFIRRATIAPIGLPGEHQRLLECLGSKHGGLVGLEHLTLEIWNLSHVPGFISTCLELMQHHQGLKTLFGRGIDAETQLQVGDIPAKLRLAMAGQAAGHRECILNLTATSTIITSKPCHQKQTLPITGNHLHHRHGDSTVTEDNSNVDLISRGRPTLNLAVPQPRVTIWSRYKLRRKEGARRKR